MSREVRQRRMLAEQKQRALEHDAVQAAELRKSAIGALTQHNNTFHAMVRAWATVSQQRIVSRNGPTPKQFMLKVAALTEAALENVARARVEQNDEMLPYFIGTFMQWAEMHRVIVLSMTGKGRPVNLA